MSLKNFIQRIRGQKDQKGATMIEYALLAALISVAAVVVLTQIGPKLVTAFTNVLNAL